MKDIIQTSSKVGDVVLDPFVGSGVICDAARQLERHFWGCVQSALWVRRASARVALPVQQIMFRVRDEH